MSVVTLISSPIKSVCVYCGSSNHIDDDFNVMARHVGTALAEHKLRVIYGGGKRGLMGQMADAALKAGGEVVGIIPEFIRAHEIQHTGLTELHVVDSMHIRKSMMVERADAFVVLPGGFGTMDETFEVLTWKQLNLHTKPIVIFNYKGFWQPLLDLLDHMIARGFSPDENALLFSVVDNVDDLFTALAAPQGPVMDPATKWF